MVRDAQAICLTALPTRIARRGTCMTSHGRLTVKNAKYARDFSPIDDWVTVTRVVITPVPISATLYSKRMKVSACD